MSHIGRHSKEAAAGPAGTAEGGGCRGAGGRRLGGNGGDCSGRRG